MAHYLAIEHTNIDYGTDKIHVYVNKQSGIYWVQTIYFPEKRHIESFTEIVAEVYEAIPKSLGSSINVEQIYY